jgi:uncharacterized protein (TIGR02588 family)
MASGTAPHRKQQASAKAWSGAATSKWEWVSAGLGLLLVLGAVSYLDFKALTTDPFVLAVTLTHLGTEQTAGGHVVRFRARNSSAATAAALTISGELYDGSTLIETSEVTLDYLPPRAERQGGLIFQNDPSAHDLRLEPRGYVDP